jgi:hypothetical protein
MVLTAPFKMPTIRTGGIYIYGTLFFYIKDPAVFMVLPGTGLSNGAGVVHGRDIYRAKQKSNVKSVVGNNEDYGRQSRCIIGGSGKRMHP